jgi:hypothetical protein
MEKQGMGRNPQAIRQARNHNPEPNLTIHLLAQPKD